MKRAMVRFRMGREKCAMTVEDAQYAAVTYDSILCLRRNIIGIGYL